jgi:hypothetical protein
MATHVKGFLLDEVKMNSRMANNTSFFIDHYFTDKKEITIGDKPGELQVTVTGSACPVDWMYAIEINKHIIAGWQFVQRK